MPMSSIATVLSARMASSRLPGKAMLPLGGVPIIQFIVERLRQAQRGGKLILATTTRSDDDILAHLAKQLDILVFRGADTDVAGRYVALAHEFKLDWIVRVTGDCPFIDAASLDYCLAQWQPSTTGLFWSTKGEFPVGIDYELISCAALRSGWPSMTAEEREHVTLRFYRSDEANLYGRQFLPPAGWPRTTRHFTVDTPDDYRQACEWVGRLRTRKFPVSELLKLSGA